MKSTILIILAVFFQAAPLVDGKSEAAPRGQIAFTFDDAPRGDGPFFSGAERAEALIAALDAAEVPGAMFFVTTQNIEKWIDGVTRLQDYVIAGHVLANHSHSHPWLWRSEPKDYIADIDKASVLLKGFEGVAPYYRFPFLDEGRSVGKRDAVRTALAERGLSNGYVTVDNYDWYMPVLVKEAVAAGHDIDMDVLRDTYVEVLVGAVDFYDAIARETLGRSPRHVLLLHENDLAALFVDDLAEALKADGWEIIPALTAYEDPIAEQEPETVFLGQGRVAALAHNAGAKPRDLVHEAEDEEYLRALFIERGLLPSSTDERSVNTD